jgi:hypothetical protein
MLSGGKGLKKLVIATIGLLLLLLASATQVIDIKSAKADNASIIWRSTGASEWYYGTQWYNENNEAYSVCNYIESLYANYREYERLDLYEDSEVTQSAVYTVAEDCNDYDYTTVFNYAHGGYSTMYGLFVIPPFQWYDVPVTHYKYYAYGGAAYSVFDRYLYPYTSYGTHQFVFQYTCAQAQQVGWYDYDWQDEWGGYYVGTGAVAFAHAWTHQDDSILSNNGYANPDTTSYCYIGFGVDWSKPLCDYAADGITYGDFVKIFYQRLLQYGDTINDALDAASSSVWGEGYTFGDTVLYNGYTDYLPYPFYNYFSGCMRVFGNGYNVIP